MQYVLVLYRNDGTQTYVGPYDDWNKAAKEGDRLKTIPEEGIWQRVVENLYPHED